MLTKQLEVTAANDSACKLLMSAPGVGPITSLAVTSALEDPSRFPDAARVASYLGLSPGESSSSTRVKRTGITKAGCTLARKYLTQASLWRWVIAVAILIWGFWFPPYEWGVWLLFAPQEHLFGALGLIGFPAAPIPLAILFLRYPAGNRPLFYALTAYAVVGGLAMVSLKVVPDIPFFVLGVTALLLVLYVRSRQTQPLTQKGR